MAEREWEISRAEGGLEGKTVQDFIYFEGMFNPILRFAFTNVLDVPFLSHWNSNPYNVASHVTVKLPHHLAVKFTKEIVDTMMQADNKGLAMAVPANRKPYEDRVLKILPSEQSTELEIIKSEFIEQITRDANRPAGEADEQSPASTLDVDFEDLKKRDFSDQPKRSPGRPKKV